MKKRIKNKSRWAILLLLLLGTSTCTYNSMAQCAPDTQPPTATCQDPTIYLDANGQATLTPADVDNGSTDNCNLASLNLSQTSFTCADIGGQPFTNEALTFDGNDDYVHIPNSTTLNDYGATQEITIEYWVKPSSTLSNPLEGIVSKRPNTNNAGFICSRAYTPQDVDHYLRFTTGWHNLKIAYNVGVWNHIALTYKSGDGMKVYRNGTLAGTLATSGILVTSSANMQIGGEFNGLSGRFNGAVDEVRIWKVARTQAEIQASMTDCYSGTDPNLLAYYNMQDGTGSSTLSDLSGNGNNGTLTNMDINAAWGSGTTLANCTAGTPVTLTATDQAGNTDACTAQVVVLDTLPPAVACLNPTIYLDANGQATLTPADVDNGTTDNCGLASLSISQTNFTCNDIIGVPYSNEALDFDGLDDYVDIPHTASFNDYVNANEITIEFWVKPLNNSTDPWEIVLAKRSNTNVGGFVIDKHITYNFRRHFLYFVGSGWQSVNFNYAHNTWNHVAYTFKNGDGMKGYLNGALVATNPISGTLNASTFPFQLGGETYLTDYNFSGSLDEVRVWKVARTQAEIQAGMNNCLSAADPNLIAYYDMQDGTGSTTLTDQSGNGHNGTLNNMDANSDWTAGSNLINCANGSQITLTATDLSGNTANCTATVTVLDTLSPTVTCQNQTVYLDVNGEATITSSQVATGATDNCGIASISLSDSTFDCSNIAALDHAVNMEGTDGFVYVPESPSLNPQQFTVEAWVYSPDWTSHHGSQIFSKGSANDEWGLFRGDFAQFNDKFAFRIYFVNDFPRTAWSTTSLQDNTWQHVAGTFNGTEMKLYINGVLESTIPIPNLTPVDGIQPIGIGRNPTFNGQQLNGKVDEARLWNVALTDAQIADRYNKTITTSDPLYPNLVMHLPFNEGSGTIAYDQSTYGNNGTFANNLDPVTGWTTPGALTNEVDLTVTDLGGNTTTCTSQITVLDTLPPVADCQSNVMVYLDANGQASITAADIDNGSSDNCSIDTMTLSKTDFDCNDLFSGSAVNMEGTNGFVYVPESPSLNPQQFTVEAWVYSPDWTSHHGSQIFSKGSANDEWGLFRGDFTQFNDKFAFRIYFVNDFPRTAWSTTSLQDNTWQHVAGTFNGTEMKLYINGVLESTIPIPNLTPVDGIQPIGIGRNPTFNGQQLNGKVDEARLWDVALTDAQIADRYNRTITPSDPLYGNLVMYLPFDEGSGTVANDQSTYGNNGSFANGLDPVTGWFSPGAITGQPVTLTVTDLSGNASTCNAVVTVKDTIAPTITCTNDTILNNDPGTCEAVVSLLAPTVADNCTATGSIALTNDFNGTADASDTYPVGTTIVTWSATDASGNVSTCQMTVTVNDVELPIAICQSPTVYLDATGQATLTLAQVNNGSSDNCGIASISLSDSTFDCSNVSGIDHAVNMEGTDGFIYVPESPSLNPAQFTMETWVYSPDWTSYHGSQIFSKGSANDEYGIFRGDFPQFNDKFAFRIYFVNDFPRTAWSTTSLQDNTWQHVAGTFNGTEMKLYINGVLESTIPIPNLTPVDGIQPIGIGRNPTFNGQQLNGKVDEVRLWNVALTDQQIADRYNRTITTADPLYSNLVMHFPCDEGSGAVAYDQSTYGNDGQFANNLDPVTGWTAPGALGNNEVEMTVVDVNGNAAVCSTLVTVLDTIAPTITCPANVIASSDAGSCGATVTVASPVVLDNCTDPSAITLVNDFNGTADASDTYPVGTTTVTWTATDQSGSSSTCQMTVTVNDTEAPIAACQDATVYLDASGQAMLAPSQIDNGSTDNCGVASISLSEDAFDCSDLSTLGSCVNMEGTDGFVLVPESPSVNPTQFTVEAWVYSPDWTSYHGSQIFSKGSANDEWGLFRGDFTQFNDKFAFRIYFVNDFPRTAWSTTSLQDNTWQHVAGTFNGTEMKLYINGVLESTIPIPNLTPVDGVEPIGIGRHPTFNGQQLNGKVDEARLWNVALTDAQIADRYNKTITTSDPLYANLVMHLPFNEGSGTVAYDQSTYGNNGIFTNNLDPVTGWDAGPVIPTPVTLTVMDLAGNLDSCTAEVTILDNIAPSIVCPADLSLTCSSGLPAADVNAVSTSDNCSQVSVVHLGDTDNGASGCAGDPLIVTRQYRATDLGGNSTTCTQTFTIESLPLSVTVTGTMWPNGYSVTCYGATDGGADMTGLSGGCPPYSYLWNTGATDSYINTGLGAGTYTLTVTDANGCTASASVTLTEPPAVVVGVTDNEKEVFFDSAGPNDPFPCVTLEGTAATSGFAPFSYNWTPGVNITGANTLTPVVCPTVNTVYTLTATDAYGCIGTVDVTVSAFDLNDPNLPLPYVGNNTNKIYLCDSSGNSISVNMNANCNSANSLCYQLSSGANLGPCPTPKTGTTDWADDLVEAGVGLQVQAYPNPFRNTAQIDFLLGYDEQVTVELFDINGKRLQLLFQGKAVNGKRQSVAVDAANLPAGIYIYRVSTRLESVTGKLTLMR